jgi:hypothetical protein
MTTAYITEYCNPNGVARDTAVAPALATQTVDIGASSVQSSAFNAQTNLIRVHVDGVCSISISVNPTATTTATRMAADTTEYFTVSPGASNKIAVIANV